MFQREQSIVITQRNDRTNLAAISHKIKTSCGIEDLGYDFSRINIARILWNFNPHWLRSQDGIPLGRPKPHCLSPYATQQLVQSLMHLLCLNKLAELLPTLRVDACIPLLERVLKNCGCVRGRKAFPCLQDQSTISFLLEMARKKEEFRIFLAPYLEDIFGVIVEFIDQAKSMDYGFLLSFFLHMLGLNCSSKDIVDLLTDFSNDRSRAMYQALYCEISKYLTEELTSTSVFFVDIFPSVTNHIRSISREATILDHQILSSSLLMASSLLNNHDCWETDSVRVEFAGIVAKWCLNIVQVISKDNEAGENSVKVLVAAVVALIASTSANDNNLIPQGGYLVVELLFEKISRPTGDIEEFYRILPSALIGVKALALNLLLMKSTLISKSFSKECVWSPLTFLLSDCIIKSLGLLFSLNLTLEHSSSKLDQSYYLQSLLIRFNEFQSKSMGSSSKIVRQLVLSSELSSRLSDRNGSLFEPFIELVIIFVCISCQEYLFTGWSQCKLKILLDHILELMKGQNIVEERTHNEVIKYLELLTVIFDGVCIISPTPSSSESIKDLSFEIGSYIYPSLIDILSYGHCSPVIIDKVCKLMGKLSARHDREFLSETLDVLCCNFSRYFMDTIKHPPSSFNFATTRKQYLLFLSHLGTGLMHLATTSFYLGGGLDCEPPRIETPSKLRHPILLGIHKALVRLFLSLANAALGKAIEESIQHVRPIEGFLKDDSAIGLLCLIPPIASTMQLLTPSKENISNSIVAQDDANMITDMGHLISYDIFSLQSFWVHIALFQFWNRNYWEKRISQVGLTHLANMNIFELSLDQIVAFTPPLVEFRGGSSILYFESEMTSNVVAKSIMKCTNTGQLYGKYDWVDACTGFSVVKEIYKTPECNHINQNVGMILTLTAVFCLEKLRIEKFGDIRMIFYYLCDEGITSSNSTIILLTSFAKEFYFTQWKSDLNRYAHLFLHKTVNRLHYIDSSTIIIFLLSRCIHSSRFVRDLAFYYIESIYQSNSELFWEYTSIFTYLRCVDILGLLVHSPALNISPPDYLSMEPWNHDIYLNILPTMEFLGSEDISETSSKLLHFGYTFLTKGALESSELLVPILQEYILHSNWTSLQKSTIDSRIGLAMAHEFCHAGRPTFHFNNNPRSALLSRERFDAALFVSQSFGISCRDSKCIPHFVPENDSLFLKSLYVGQATGLMGSPSDESKSFSHDSYVLAFQSIFRSLSDLFFREQEISVEKCEQLILRGAALLRSFALQWDSIGDIFQFASVYLNYFTLVVKKCYSHQVISTVIFVWKWLLGCSPRILGPLILSNMIATLQQQVCTLSIGLFHRHNFSCHLSLSSQYDYRPSNAKVFRAVDSPFLNSTVHSPIVPCAADCFPFELWIDFMMKIFDIHGTLHMASLFSMMEILLHDVSLFSRDSSSMIARFKLLIFAFRILKVSVVPAKTFNISVHRRRILRERVYEAIVDFFNNQNAFTATNHVIVDKEILVLHDLLTVCFEDYAIWSVDYADGISESVNIAKSQAEWFRGCGSAFAVKYLRTLMSTKHLTSSETTIGPSLRTFGIQISGALRSNVSPLDNSILWFVNAIILRHINYLVAWRTSHNFLDSLTNSQIMNLNKRFKCVLKSSDVLFSQGVQISWIFSPSLALSYCERFSFRILKSNSLSLSCLLSLITTNPESIRNDWRVLRFLSNMTEKNIFNSFSKELCHWRLSPVSVVLNLLNRRSVGLSYHSGKLRDSELMSHPVVIQYAVRCLRMQKHQHISTLQFFLPQFVQLLRRDLYGVIGEFIGELAVSSTLLCHQLIWLLQLESVDDTSNESQSTRHGYCNTLVGTDPLPALALDALGKTRSLLSVSQREYLDRECEFFNNITNISAKLREIKDKDQHSEIIKQSLLELGFHQNLYLPTDPYKAVTEVVVDSGIPMQSAAKCPFLLVFHTVPWGGPDSMSHNLVDLTNSPKSTPLRTISIRSTHRLGIGRMDSHSFHSPKIVEKGVSHLAGSSRDNLDNAEILSSASSNSEVIEATNFVTVTNPHVQAQNNKVQMMTKDYFPTEKIGHTKRVGKAKFMKNWGNWKDFRLSRPHVRQSVPFRATVLVGKHTPYPSHTSTASSGKEACIFKVYDDCRQDALTIQIVRMLKDAFEEINLPLYLVPYSVIPNRTGPDHAQGGILQVVPNVKSRDQIGKEGAKTLKQHFLNQFGSEFSSSYKQAQLEFARSAAGYAIVCYLLSIKDRHNGNILIDSEGHLIHIDFGFLLGISPGGNLGFENAAFKLSGEMIEILGGHKDAEPFRCFVDLTLQGFLVAREIALEVLITVTSLMDSGLPCFLYKQNNLDLLRERFFLEDSDSDAVLKMRKLIDDAAKKWTTIAYDGIQKLQNNIYSDSWR